MGVSGCGKTSVASLLASRTYGRFLDADNFHPPANKAKMSAGTPLTDEDRWPWLEILNRELRTHADANRPVFLACSALRQTYRDHLSKDLPTLRFIYLKGSKELIRQRMQSREDHFMPAALLDSQFAALEEPEGAFVAPIDVPLFSIVDTLLPHLSNSSTGQA